VTVHQGDLAEYSPGRGDRRRCEVLGFTPKRVRVALRTAAGVIVVRAVKPEKLQFIGGGVTDASPKSP